MSVNKELFKEAVKVVNRRNVLEDKIAYEWYGCLYDELDYDDKELVEWEARDRLEQRR